MNSKQIVAASIRARRKELGLTQAQAGARIRITQQSWGEYESGNQSITIETLLEIASALEIDARELLPKVNRQATTPKKKVA